MTDAIVYDGAHANDGMHLEGGITANDVAQLTRSPQESSEALMSAIDQAGSKVAEELDDIARTSDDSIKSAMYGSGYYGAVDLVKWAQVQQVARENEPDTIDRRVANWWTESSDGRIRFRELPAPVMILIRRMDRMSRFHVWITQDPEFASIIDTALNNRAKESSRRQVVISIIVAIVSLMAG